MNPHCVPKCLLLTILSIALVLGAIPTARPQSDRALPFDGRTFKGRIAYSADGNYNDEDDWAASAFALAIFAECGVKDKLVHFDYNCILPKTDPAWEKTHEISVLGAAERYGYSKSVFHDCQKDLDGAVKSITKAVNESSADNPLYFVLAGPMEVPYMGIRASDPTKRKFVYCISHNCWNDGYASADLVNHNKRHVIPLGITWIQITDQNRLLSTSRYGRPANPEEWRPWEWMKESDDPKVHFLRSRMEATTRADCSDSGMAYFLMTGDEDVEIAEVRALLDDNRIPTPMARRSKVRLEAENFRTLDNYEVEYRNDRQVSQRINLKLASLTGGRIATPFNEPYTASSARYDVDVRYFDEDDGRCALRLVVNGEPQGAAWKASGDDEAWRTHTIPDVAISRGDEIMVEVRGDGGEYGKLDYVQLNYRSAGSTASASRPSGDSKPTHWPTILSSASAPACAIMPSCCAVTPLTPIAPITSPSAMIGTPPSKGVPPGRATITVRPCAICSSHTFVGRL